MITYFKVNIIYLGKLLTAYFENRIISEPYITGKLLNDDIVTFLYNEPNNLVGSNQFTSMTSKRYSTVSLAKTQGMKQ